MDFLKDLLLDVTPQGQKASMIVDIALLIAVVITFIALILFFYGQNLAGFVLIGFALLGYLAKFYTAYML